MKKALIAIVILAAVAATMFSQPQKVEADGGSFHQVFLPIIMGGNGTPEPLCGFREGGDPDGNMIPPGVQIDGPAMVIDPSPLSNAVLAVYPDAWISFYDDTALAYLYEGDDVCLESHFGDPQFEGKDIVPIR